MLMFYFCFGSNLTFKMRWLAAARFVFCKWRVVDRPTQFPAWGCGVPLYQPKALHIFSSSLVLVTYIMGGVNCPTCSVHGYDWLVVVADRGDVFACDLLARLPSKF